MGNILIVEDDINIRKLIAVNLEKRGYKISEAVDGNEAMFQFRQQAFDLVLLDLVLPGMSGVDVCIWIRARSDTPIIVISGLRDEDLKVMALDAGADLVVTRQNLATSSTEALALQGQAVRLVWKRQHDLPVADGI